MSSSLSLSLSLCFCMQRERVGVATCQRPLTRETKELAYLEDLSLQLDTKKCTQGEKQEGERREGRSTGQRRARPLGWEGREEGGRRQIAVRWKVRKILTMIDACSGWKLITTETDIAYDWVEQSKLQIEWWKWNGWMAGQRHYERACRCRDRVARGGECYVTRLSMKDGWEERSNRGSPAWITSHLHTGTLEREREWGSKSWDVNVEMDICWMRDERDNRNRNHRYQFGNTRIKLE